MFNSNKKTGYVWTLAAVTIAVYCTLSIQCVLAAPYSECRVPPQIAFSTPSNVLLVMDFSGSMQLPAYYDTSTCSWEYTNARVYNDYTCSSIISEAYTPATTYYGLFDSDLYYKYDFDKGWFYSIGATADDGTANRIGTLAIGISGNLLNWALTSRIDTAMKALIGGKVYDESGGDCDAADSNCYIRGEGARRYLRASTTGTNYIDADFYIRPATWTAETTSGYTGAWSGLPNGTGPYPDDYKTPNQSYPVKDLVVSIRANYRGQLDSADPQAFGKYYEMWGFTLTKRTRVDLTLTGSWGSALWKIYASANTPEGQYLASYSGNPATGSVLLEAGTYYVRAAPADTHSPWYTGTYTLASNVHLTPVAHAAHNGPSLTRTIGALPWGAVRARISPGDRTGLVQQTWNKVRWGFLYYQGDANGSTDVERLLVRCGEAGSATEFARYMEGKVADSKFPVPYGHQPYPYSGTPTGEAVREAARYFQQSSASDNDDKITYAGQYDPYYAGVGGAYRPLTCRKSYVVLVSDGNWADHPKQGVYAGGVVDPVKWAYNMHSGDIRQDVEGTQNVTLYSVFTFSKAGTNDYTWGSNSMKWTALYGGWRELPNCKNKWPYDKAGTPPEPSTDQTFNIANCSKAVPDACCKEWDMNYDMYASGDGLGKGIPDNYFEPKTGSQLRDTLVKILSAIEQQTASSSAVATVAQQTGEGDIIIRGMFQAKPPEEDTVNVGRFLWFGHLESFWPSSDGFYDFEKYTQIMCKDIRANHPAFNCWDAAMPSSLSGGQWPPATSIATPGGSGRHIFTFKKDTTGTLVKTTFNTSNITTTDLGVTTNTERDAIVNWVLGTDVSGYRTRTDMNGTHWTLGDLVYSTPVVVGPPSLGAVSDMTKAFIGGSEVGIVFPPSADTSARYYLNWRQTDAAGRSVSAPCVTDSTKSVKFRDKVVYVGGNDGMLHAFLLQVYDYRNKKWAIHPTDYDSNTCPADRTRIGKIGKEIWAYMPSNLLTEVKSLAASSYAVDSPIGTCRHRFMVDLAPRGWEVFFDEQTDITDPEDLKWHTVLIGGERGGGDMYFALDVTDPWDPKVLWEYSVLKDMTVQFDSDHAATALRSACQAGTAINPGTVASCQVPVPPSSWWPSCSSWSIDDCKTNLSGQSQFAGDRFWNPFDETAYATLKKLPMSWSTPYVGRVKLPSGSAIDACPLGTGCAPTCPTGWSAVSGVHNFVFIGGGIRTFDKELDIFDTLNLDSRKFYKDGFWRLLWEPFMLALDIRTGRNAFRYVWPEIVKATRSMIPQSFAEKLSPGCAGTDCLRIPYALSDPVVLDLWSTDTTSAGEDGYEDSIYVADLNGLVYGIKFNLDAGSLSGLYVDLWRVKPIPLNLWRTPGDLNSNWYRSNIQPLTVQPALALEPQDPGTATRYVRVVIGAGKHDDIEGVYNDQTDTAKMSLYNLRDLVDFGSLGNSSWALSDSVKGGTIPYSDANFRVRANCYSTTYRCTGEVSGEGATESGCGWLPTGSSTSWSGCRWYLPTAGNEGPDCCEGMGGAAGCNPPATPCWACVFDLPEIGEKVIGKPLIAGGVAFFTTFKAIDKNVDPCKAGGVGYLYAFDYMCRPFPPGFNPIQEKGVEVITFPTGTENVISGARASLGTGVPSQPVLDSTGKFVIVQNSNAELFRISVELGERMTQIKGWTERD